MSDFGESPKPEERIAIPLSELSLSHEQMDKMASDIITLTKLRNYAHDNGYTFALTGGYAVDAIAGGEISRFHSDMDGVFFAPDDIPYETISTGVEEQLLVEETPWVLVKDDEGSLEFREDDDRKEWEMRRRLEVDVASYTPRLVTHSLHDLDGNAREFEVLSVESLLAGKVLSAVRLDAMSQAEIEAAGLRDMKPSDKKDFLRLVNSSEFDEQSTINELAGAIRYLSEDQKLPEEALSEAMTQWQTAVTIMNSEDAE